MGWPSLAYLHRRENRQARSKTARTIWLQPTTFVARGAIRFGSMASDSMPTLFRDTDGPKYLVQQTWDFH